MKVSTGRDHTLFHVNMPWEDMSLSEEALSDHTACKNI